MNCCAVFQVWQNNPNQIVGNEPKKQAFYGPACFTQLTGFWNGAKTCNPKMMPGSQTSVQLMSNLWFHGTLFTSPSLLVIMQREYKQVHKFRKMSTGLFILVMTKANMEACALKTRQKKRKIDWMKRANTLHKRQMLMVLKLFLSFLFLIDS